MYIFVEALTGLKIRMKVEDKETVENIKYRIMSCEDLPIEEQHLIYQYKELENHKILSDYQIGNGATIRLIMKMKGGPLSLDVGYEEILSESTTNSLADQFAIIFLENGELRLLPISGLELQNKLINQAKEDLNDPSIFSSLDEPLNDQKLTILKLKMDCIRIGKKLSSMTRQTDSDKPLPSSNETQLNRSNKTVNSSLHRSVSLDSRSVEYVPDVSNYSNKYKSQFHSNQSHRPPTSAIFRTSSVLDSSKTKQNFISSFPPLQNSPNTRQKPIFTYQKSKEASIEKKLDSRHRLPPLNESEFENKKSTSRKPRCLICSRKMSLANEFVCRCGGHFCMKHRYPEEHNCRFDYKYNGKLELMKSNPIIESKKIEKI